MYGWIQYFLFSLILRCRYQHDTIQNSSSSEDDMIATDYWATAKTSPIVCRTHDVRSNDILLGNYFFKSRQRRVTSRRPSGTRAIVNSDQSYYQPELMICCFSIHTWKSETKIKTVSTLCQHISEYLLLNNKY